MAISRKYPRTPHFPFSPGKSRDDRVISSVQGLLNVPIVISDKMDGSNCSLEYDGCYARTHAHAPTHASFDGLKALHATIKDQIPQGTQLFGEWVFARHALTYTDLPSYFFLFGVRYLDDDPDEWACWSEVELWAQEMGVPTVPILFKGQVSSEKELKDLVEDLAHQPSVYGPVREGVVVRVADLFADQDFGRYIAKWVKADHVDANSDHWAHKEIVKNTLKTR